MELAELSQDDNVGGGGSDEPKLEPEQIVSAFFDGKNAAQKKKISVKTFLKPSNPYSRIASRKIGRKQSFGMKRNNSLTGSNAVNFVGGLKVSAPIGSEGDNNHFVLWPSR